MNQNELMHSDFYLGTDHDNGLKHWKYIKKYKGKSGKWVYVYKNKMINKIDKNANAAYRKITNTYKDVTSGNMYDTNHSDYDEKIKQIMNTKEWRDIVARRDPEYVSTDKNGNTVYKIDDYLVKKKHPGLDLLDDAANGRDLTLNQINIKTLTAGANNYVKTGLSYIGIISGLLTTKIKYYQGSYDTQEKNIEQNINDGKNFIKRLINTL